MKNELSHLLYLVLCAISRRWRRWRRGVALVTPEPRFQNGKPVKSCRYCNFYYSGYEVKCDRGGYCEN